MWKILVDAECHLIDGAFAAVDPGMGTVLRHGLYMEVLAWKMHLAEPEGCSCISHALIKGQSVALKTTGLTWMAVLTCEVGRQLETAVVAEVALEAVKDKLRDELDMHVDEPGFI